MVAEASAQIKKQAAERKLEKQRLTDEMNENNDNSITTPVNGKRSIQPKKAFLLAIGADANEENSSDDE